MEEVVDEKEVKFSDGGGGGGWGEIIETAYDFDYFVIGKDFFVIN